MLPNHQPNFTSARGVCSIAHLLNESAPSGEQNPAPRPQGEGPRAAVSGDQLQGHASGFATPTVGTPFLPRFLPAPSQIFRGDMRPVLSAAHPLGLESSSVSVLGYDVVEVVNGNRSSPVQPVPPQPVITYDPATLAALSALLFGTVNFSGMRIQPAKVYRAKDIPMPVLPAAKPAVPPSPKPEVRVQPPPEPRKPSKVERKRPSSEIVFSSPKQIHNRIYLPSMELSGLQTGPVRHFGSYKERSKVDTADLTGQIMSLSTAITSIKHDEDPDKVLEMFGEDPCCCFLLGIPGEPEAGGDSPKTEHVTINPERFCAAPRHVAARDYRHTHYLLEQLANEQDLLAKQVTEDISFHSERDEHSKAFREQGLNRRTTFSSMAKKLWPTMPESVAHKRKDIKPPEKESVESSSSAHQRLLEATQGYMDEQYKYLCSFLNVRPNDKAVPQVGRK